MNNTSILVVEDEEDIQELVEYNLTKDGYEVDCVPDGCAGLREIKESPPDLVLLDIMLPGMDGLEVCRQLKQDPATQQVPVVMMTAKGEESDIVTGLELGAEDYITKPFSPRVLTARIRTILRRQNNPVSDPEESLSIHGLVIHPGRHEVLLDRKYLKLTLTEFKILHLLAMRPGWVFTRYQIVDQIRGEDYAVTDRSVDVHIVALRRKLGSVCEVIETVRGVGYRMKE